MLYHWDFAVNHNLYVEPLYGMAARATFVDDGGVFPVGCYNLEPFVGESLGQ